MCIRDSFMVAWHEEADRALRRLADTDGLTGLLNRRAFTVRSEALLAHARRHDDPGVFILLDIDHFKQVNDRHGHALGDEVLRTFARVLKSSLRRGDLAVRWGGEEFGILLARAEGDAARCLDQRLRTAVKQAVRLPGQGARAWTTARGSPASAQRRRWTSWCDVPTKRSTARRPLVVPARWRRRRSALSLIHI